MTKRPPIYGLGWLESDAVTFTAVIGQDSPAAQALGALATSRPWQPVTRAHLAAVLGALPPGTGEPLPGVLRDMIDTDEEDGDIVLVADRADEDGDHPYVAALRDLDASGRYGVAYGEAHWWPSQDPATDPMPLIEAWAKRWPDSLPIAHELKEIFEDRWVRFHSLPGSKRIATDPAEAAEVLARHNTVLGDLASGGHGLPRAEELIVIVADVATTPMPAEPDTDFWAAVPWHYEDPDLLFAHLFVTVEIWVPGVLDELLRLVAAEEVGGVIIAPPDLGWLYHPYAGGADVVLPDAAIRVALAAAHAEWRSSHPSGL